MAELKVTVPIKFSEKAQKDLYETCMEYKELAEMRGAENDKLRELLRDLWQFTGAACKKYPKLFDQAAQGGQSVQPNTIDLFEQRMRELGVVE